MISKVNKTVYVLGKEIELVAGKKCYSKQAIETYPNLFKKEDKVLEVAPEIEAKVEEIKEEVVIEETVESVPEVETQVVELQDEVVEPTSAIETKVEEKPVPKRRWKTKTE